MSSTRRPPEKKKAPNKCQRPNEKIGRDNRSFLESGSCAFQIGVEEEGPGSRKKRRRLCFELRVKILFDSNSVVGIQLSGQCSGSRNIQEEPDDVGPLARRAFKEEAFFTGAEAVQHAAIIAEGEGISQIEATRLERILPQLLLDF